MRSAGLSVIALLFTMACQSAPEPKAPESQAVRFLDRPAFNNGHVHHLGLGSWKPRRGLVDQALRRVRTAF